MLYQALTEVGPVPGMESAGVLAFANISFFGDFWCLLVRFGAVWCGFWENGQGIAGGAGLRRADTSDPNV